MNLAQLRNYLVVRGQQPTRYTWSDILDLIMNSSGGGGLTPEQEAKLNAITITGSGNMYLADDGTYKQIPTFDNFEIFPSQSDFPSPGDPNVLYLAAETGNLYWWDGTSYQITDQGLFNNYLPLSGGTIGFLNITGNLNDIPVADYIYYTTDSENNPVVLLRPNTKIAEGDGLGNPVHEILGINNYTDIDGTFAQFENGSQSALWNANLVYDNRTAGHMTADVYNASGSLNSKKVVAYIEDVIPAIVSSTGTATTISGLPQSATVVSVNYNRLLLFSTDYIVDPSAGTLTITNTDITSNMSPTDRIEISYIDRIL